MGVVEGVDKGVGGGIGVVGKGMGVAGVSIEVVEGVGKGLGVGVAGVSIEVVEGVGKGLGDGVGVVGKGMGVGVERLRVLAPFHEHRSRRRRKETGKHLYSERKSGARLGLSTHFPFCRRYVALQQLMEVLT